MVAAQAHVHPDVLFQCRQQLLVADGSPVRVPGAACSDWVSTVFILHSCSTSDAHPALGVMSHNLAGMCIDASTAMYVRGLISFAAASAVVAVVVIGGSE